MERRCSTEKNCDNNNNNKHAPDSSAAALKTSTRETTTVTVTYKLPTAMAATANVGTNTTTSNVATSTESNLKANLECGMIYCKLTRVFVMTIMSCVSVCIGLFAIAVYATSLVLYVIKNGGKYGAMLCTPIYNAIIPMSNTIDTMASSCWECMQCMHCVQEAASSSAKNSSFMCTTVLASSTLTKQQ